MADIEDSPATCYLCYFNTWKSIFYLSEHTVRLRKIVSFRTIRNFNALTHKLKPIF